MRGGGNNKTKQLQRSITFERFELSPMLISTKWKQSVRDAGERVGCLVVSNIDAIADLLGTRFSSVLMGRIVSWGLFWLLTSVQWSAPDVVNIDGSMLWLVPIGWTD